MPVVTAIKKQAKRARYSIFVDDRYSFSCSELGLSTLGIAVGDELDRSTLEDKIGQAEVDRYYDRVLNYLAIRPRSNVEIARYLKRKDCDEEVATHIINRLTERNLIDDSDFAKRWVESRQLNRPRSKRHLAYELRQKGLDKDDIEATTAELDDVETLKNLFSTRGLLQKYPDRRKLMAYLARQGFNYDAIQAALSDQAGD